MNSLTFDSVTLSTKDKQFTLPDHSCNNADYQKVEIKNYAVLQKIIIGNDCFTSVAKVLIAKCNSLEEIVIGSNSFIYPYCKSCIISTCKNLKTIHLKEGALKYVNTLTIRGFEWI